MPRGEGRRKLPRLKRLVVDASVLRAAGSEDAIHPVPSHCRDVLKVILAEAHRAAVTDAILEEWKRHASGFAHKWLSRMYARGRIVTVIPVSCEDIHAICRGSARFSERERDAFEKDIRLIEAAQAADKTILSLDEVTRAILRKLTAETRALNAILWANPASEFESLRVWLVKGRPLAPHWRLTVPPASRA